MNLSTTLAEIASLDIDERIQLVEAIWDSIAAEGRQLGLTETQRKELERRLADHASSPNGVRVKEEAIARVRQ